MASSARRAPCRMLALVVPPLALLPASLHAQLVRGAVTEETTRVPLAGTLVTLTTRDGDTRTVLTDDRGRFAIRAPEAGEYTLELKRIGVRRTVTSPFALASGETREMDVALAGVPQNLSELRITEAARCAARPSDGEEMAAIWEDARAALMATRLTRHDARFIAKIVRFRRMLDPSSMNVQSEDRQEQTGVTLTPFKSAATGDLSRRGYVVGDSNVMEYRGPDADVLLSDAFISEHCFGTVQGTRKYPSLVGLSFQPVEGRSVPDIAGVLWLDRATHELRRLEFTYTRLPHKIKSDQLSRLGGEVDYKRMPTGAWIVERWAIRMPMITVIKEQGSPTGPASFNVVMRERLTAIVEEGGEVTRVPPR